jgi:hypothetical protein
LGHHFLARGTKYEKCQEGCHEIRSTDTVDIGESGGIQLPLIEGHEAFSDKPQSWIMWFEKWSDSLNEDAYAEALEQYEASGGKW